MLNRSNAERTVLGLSLALLFTAGLFASCTSKPRTSVTQDCAKVRDRQLAREIKRRAKADRRFDNQGRHINVSVRNREVTLEGWVAGEDAIKILEKYAQEQGCVTKVINRLSVNSFVGGCGPGQKRCGDICIDQTSQCNIVY
ncbi:MAG: BON domain-containing protein [Blastocatellia bacterium]